MASSSPTKAALLAAVALAFVQSTWSQGDDGQYYYTDVERNFAQVQPAIFPGPQSTNFFDNQETRGNFRSSPQDYGDAHQIYENPDQPVFPSPNYNQHPSPFQLPTGRSQPSGQYYLNQADFSEPQRHFNRPVAHNFQLTHPASTSRPDPAHLIHSAVYQHDPSKPETFLGQITINNPDTDYIKARQRGFATFNSPQFKDNSLRNSNSDSDNSAISEKDTDDDLFHPISVTTYNPTKTPLNLTKPKGRNQNRNTATTESTFTRDRNVYTAPRNRYQSVTSTSTTSAPIPSRYRGQSSTRNPPRYQVFSTRPNRLHLSSNRQSTRVNENKAVFDLEPLLEDDIKDINSFSNYLKNNQNGSNDVEVIKEHDPIKVNMEQDDDSDPSASSVSDPSKANGMSAPNMIHTKSEQPVETPFQQDNNKDELASEEDNLSSSQEILNHNNGSQSLNQHKESIEFKYETAEPINNEESYVTEHMHSETDSSDIEYYDEEYDHTGLPTHKGTQSTAHSEDASDEYEEINDNEGLMVTESYTSQHDNVTEQKTHEPVHVTEQTAHEPLEEEYDDITEQPEKGSSLVMEMSASEESYSSIESDSDNEPSILGQEVVSVVTTKSVVNGTISIPDVTFPPAYTKQVTTSTTEKPTTVTENPMQNVTESWVVVASVQTSRSVSGARFLPFPTVEQEEKKQILSDLDDETSEDNSDLIPKQGPVTAKNTTVSTESIIDMLDRVQSELSSDILSGTLKKDDKNIAIIQENQQDQSDTTTPLPPLQLFTLRTQSSTEVTKKASPPAPPQVTIKKLSPYSRPTSTTPKPKKLNFDGIQMDDLTGLLPAGFKPRHTFGNRRKNNTHKAESKTEEIKTNSTQGRSSGITFKNKVTIQDDASSLLPKDYKDSKGNTKLDNLFKTVKQDDLSKFLPPGFKNTVVEQTTEKSTITTKKSDISNLFANADAVDISAFLPKDFKPTTTQRTVKTTKSSATIVDDISALLPPGFKLNSSSSSPDIILPKLVKVDDIASLLPPGYNLTESKDTNDTPADTSSTTKGPNSGFKVVFPSRPGSKPNRKITTAKPNSENGPGQVAPVIHKGWPTRASTEFTGWPTPSTTPFSIEKLLEAQRNATATSSPELSSSSTRRPTTPTTTTTTPAPPPTTPGICRHDCDLAGTIKIVAGVSWVPELLDHNTEEWKALASDVAEELNSVYSKSYELKKWYKGVRIDAFSKGSVLVDYFVELNDISDKVDTLDIKKMFHRALTEARPGSVTEEITEKSTPFDPDIMVGDQPEEDRVEKPEEIKKIVVDKSKGKLEVGKFVVDPMFTEFIVLPKRVDPTVGYAEDNSLLPQWGIAVIVIALASLLFVVIFGVTVLVNRQKSAKAKQPIPLSEDMLRDLDKSHMGGVDDLYLKEREVPYTRSKRLSLAEYPGAAGDSWRSEWTPQLQQLAQHYAPDSGRGSQIYGHMNYGYSGSQLYGHTGGGSQLYGYAGERAHYPRRRSDFDSNF